MSSRHELKILKGLDRQLTDAEQEAKKQTVKRTAIYAVAWFALVGAFMLVMKGELLGIIAVAVASFAGILAGIAIYSGIAANQWPIVRPHINKESIEARVKQLET